MWPFLSVIVPIGRTCLGSMGMWQRECGTDPAQDESCLFNLCQDPRKRRSWTYCASGGYVLPTLRFSGSLLWSPKLKRWLLLVECVGNAAPLPLLLLLLLLVVVVVVVGGGGGVIV